MNDNILVSICIPTYNMGKYISTAIESSLNQTYHNIEVIVCDNNSEDDTEVVVEKYLSDKKVKYFRLEKNIGMAGNFNYSAELATGKIIKFLCADDFLDKYAIKNVVAIFKEYPDVKLISFGRKILNENTRKIVNNKNIINGLFNGNEIINLFYKNINPVGNPSNVAIMSDDFNNTGGFDLSYPENYMNDTELWLRYIKNKKVYFDDYYGVTILNHNQRNGVHGEKEWIDVYVNYKMIQDISISYKDVIRYMKCKIIYAGTLLTLRFMWRSLQGLRNNKFKISWLSTPFKVMGLKFLIILTIAVVAFPFYTTIIILTRVLYGNVEK